MKIAETSLSCLLFPISVYRKFGIINPECSTIITLEVHSIYANEFISLTNLLDIIYET